MLPEIEWSPARTTPTGHPHRRDAGHDTGPCDPPECVAGNASATPPPLVVDGKNAYPGSPYHMKETEQNPIADAANGVSKAACPTRQNLLLNREANQ